MTDAWQEGEARADCTLWPQCKERHDRTHEGQQCPPVGPCFGCVKWSKGINGYDVLAKKWGRK